MNKPDGNGKIKLIESANNALVLAVVGVFIAGVIIGPVVIVWSNRLIRDMTQQHLSPKAIRIAKTARVVGSVALALHAVCITIFALWIAFLS